MGKKYPAKERCWIKSIHPSRNEEGGSSLGLQSEDIREEIEANNRSVSHLTDFENLGWRAKHFGDLPLGQWKHVKILSIWPADGRIFSSIITM
ncbi:hypothetical protein [Desulfopila aestuarii]|uniref:hypothetical protein n=1 Tax=Desulfopila aestuarii TaxID=231440 RepID=UPI0011614168|nr:hypothetical protein [Desulfopila aestuarii]